MKKYLAIAALTVLATPVFAGDVYLVGSVGLSKVNIDTAAFDTALTNAGAVGVRSTTDDSDTGYKLQVGYKFNPNFAIEGGYIDFGKVSYSATFTGGSANASAKASGWNVDAVGILPINDAFSLFGKVGLIDAKVDVSVSATGPGGSASGSANTTKWRGTYGLGGTYDFTKNVGMRVEYERFSELGDSNNTGKSNVDLYSLGVVYKF